MKICVIAGNYPSEGNPKHVFLEKIVKEFVDLGNECTVIAPQSKGKNLKRKLKCEYLTDRGNAYTVYSPVYHSFSGRRIGPVHLGNMTHRSFCSAVENVCESENIVPDVFYSHFINAGVTACHMAKKMGVPFFIANGESDLKSFIRTLPEKKVRETYALVSGIISVSTANKNETMASGFFPSERQDIIHVLPNGVNHALFFKKDKSEVRKKLGIDEKCFIAIFVGQFSERKGCLRVAEALKKCDNVYSIFIGSGPLKAEHDKCIYMGRVDNTQLPDYLNAADVFVLPTLQEGCCNAIIEALACGVPVISSDRDFNYDILDEKCALLIDPNNVDEIAGAIEKIHHDPSLAAGMSDEAVKKASSLRLDLRAEKILNIMKKVVS